MANGDNPDAIGTTTIGPTVIIRGRLKVDENLTVKGRIDAEISSSQVLTIETSGVVKADVRARSVKISGVLVGNTTADEKIEIAPDGRVVGDLRAPRIVISDGAAFRGGIDMRTADEQGESEAAAAPPPTAAVAIAAVASVPPADAVPPQDLIGRDRPARPGSRSGRRH
jgi:cytoskeletal protein CcmA (bactofilin family)